PVIGMAVGAMPEIVEDGRTGCLIEPGADAATRMAAAITRVGEIDRGVCRAVAQERFPLSRMMDGYARLYQQLALRDPQRLGVSEEHPALVVTRRVGVEEIEVEEVREDASFAKLKASWEALWSRDVWATPFQHPAWMLPWWRQFGPDGELRAVVLRDLATRELLGVLPLYVYRKPEPGERQLLLLGAGTTDYLDGVWGEEDVELAARALRFVLHNLDRWDTASLPQLRQGSRLRLAAKELGLSLGASEPCSTIDLRAELPAKIRANVGRYRRRAESSGGVSCTVAENEHDALGGFEALVRLHSSRWERRGEDGVLCDSRVLSHHRESVPLLLQAGLLCLFHLTLSGETIGVLYALADGAHVAERRLYLYLIGFDERFKALSPGTLLVHEAWMYARERGFAKLDLLRGGEAYKQLWGAAIEETSVLQLPASALTVVAR
ncbi:MAG TPA: GNAT family N-acetyltransferase, partial [Acidobacteriaceae bacterium]|nr:GNAT family N-acetyltransferase [Acidobacteriaceae bacterium]